MKSFDPKIFTQSNCVLNFALIVLSNIFVSFFIGQWISSLTKSVVWTIVFLFLGVISGLYCGIKELIREAEKYEGSGKKNAGDDKKDSSSFRG